MKTWLAVLVAVWGASTPSLAKYCSSQWVKDKPYDKGLSRLARLNPALYEQVKKMSPVDLYLALKAEEYRYFSVRSRPSPVSDELREHLVTTFANAYDIAALSPSALTQFYLNALNALYRGVATDIMVSLYERWGHEVVTPETRDFAIRVVSGFLHPADLSDRYLTPERAADVLRPESVPVFPWALGLRLAQRYVKGEKAETWLALQPEAAILEAQERERLQRALSAQASSVCCVSTPGCFNCPLNRAHLFPPRSKQRVLLNN